MARDPFPFDVGSRGGAARPPSPAAPEPAPQAAGSSATAGAASASANAPSEFETVTALTSRLRQSVESGFQRVLVRGEVSNWKPSPSGHIYFSLKDDGAVLSCVLWKTTAQRGDIAARAAAVRDGSGLCLTGRLTVYEPRGQYQLVVSDLKPSGLGDLYQRFLELKEKLAKEGLFDPARKRPIPAMVRRIGIVTSLRGAALRDVVNVARRRCPGATLVIAAAVVQGAGAPAEVVAALGRLAVRARAGEIDVAIVCRGGGSFEDLACFNDESIARAIAAFPLPVVTGIGHETDWTIADFVADLRAPTPSAAAESAVPNVREWARRVEQLRLRATRLIRGDVERRRLRLQRLARHPAFHDPYYAVNRLRQRVDDLAGRAARLATTRLARERRRLVAIRPRLEVAAAALAPRARRRFGNLAARLGALDPRAVLARGYAIVSRMRGDVSRVISTAAEAPSGALLTVQFSDAAIEARSLGTPATDARQLEIDLDPTP